MSKAIEKAYEAYPLNEENHLNHGWNAKRVGFQQGYEQAEKDLELGWEQIYSILYFEREVLREFGNEEHSNEEVCKEVLKRFKDLKKY